MYAVILSQVQSALMGQIRIPLGEPQPEYAECSKVCREWAAFWDRMLSLLKFTLQDSGVHDEGLCFQRKVFLWFKCVVKHE